MILEALFSLFVTEVYRLFRNHLNRQRNNDACVDIRYLVMKR
jgi:hypothetical protein